jgi:hypothetical protein
MNILVTDGMRPADFAGPDLVSGRARMGSRTGNPRPDTRSGPTRCVTTVGNLIRIITRYDILVRQHINYITDVMRPVGPDLASGRARVGGRTRVGGCTGNSRPDTRSGPTILPVA